MTEPNWVNRTIFTGDNLHVLRGMNSHTVDLVYLDPPFNSNRNYSAPVGSQAAGAAFKDTWTLSDVDLAWHDQLRHHHPALHDVILAARGAAGDGMMSYLLMMAIRLIELHRVLKPTGSIYLHCDPTASHYLKLVMDSIWGRDQFRNEIVWNYHGNASVPKCKFASKHDVLLFYGGEEMNPVYIPYTEEQATRFKETDEDGRRFYWNKNRTAGRYKIYMREGVRVGDTWTDIQNVTGYSERTGYPTQKPLALIERIIKASSNENEVVLDPFAGCATACVAAERLGRRWVGIDLSPLAAQLVQERLEADIGLTASLAAHRDDIPQRTDMGVLPAPKTHKNHLYGTQAGNCKGCGNHFPIGNFHVDHIVSRKHGGTDHLSNLQLLCGHCNSRKGTGTMSELMAKLLKQRGG